MKVHLSRSSRAHIGRRLVSVTMGEVMCPRRGLVDSEDCWICPAYRGRSAGPTAGIVCSTEPVVMPFARSVTA